MTQLASLSSESLSPDGLLLGGPYDAVKGTLLSGESRLRGALVGKVTVGAPTAAAVAGNTGTGTVGSLTIGTAAKPGVYRVVFIEPGSNAGTFVVEDPDGVQLGTGTVAVAFTAPGSPSFTISDATDFIAGDSFTITVAAGTGKFKLSTTAATDGSQVPDGILAEDCDATSADKECLVYTRGDFAEGKVTLGSAHTAASVREGLRTKGIRLIPTQPAV